MLKKKMKPIIKTDKENKVALAFVERLMTIDPSARSKEGRLLSLLAEAIQNFEKKYDRSLLSPDNEKRK